MQKAVNEKITEFKVCVNGTLDLRKMPEDILGAFLEALISDINEQIKNENKEQ